MLAAQLGGAIYVYGPGTTRIVGCVFELNAASFGGAVWAADRSGSTTIADCVFRRNRASVRHPPIAPSSLWPSRACAQVDGGAIFALRNTGRVAISGCAFDANTAENVRLSPRDPPDVSLSRSSNAYVRWCAEPAPQGYAGAVDLFKNTEASTSNSSNFTTSLTNII